MAVIVSKTNNYVVFLSYQTSLRQINYLFFPYSIPLKLFLFVSVHILSIWSQFPSWMGK